MNEQVRDGGIYGQMVIIWCIPPPQIWWLVTWYIIHCMMNGTDFVI